MNFEKIDLVIRMVCIGMICLFGLFAFVFWLIGLEHNLVWNKKAISYWGLGLGILLISLGIIFLAFFPTKIEAFFPYFYTKIIIRIPVYCIALAGIVMLFRQFFSLN
jgi:hypothetical protein